MQYQLSLVVPPATSQDNPVIETLLLDVGTLDSLDIRFPQGCCSLVHFAARMKEVQLVPWNQDAFIQSNNQVVHSELDVKITQPPMEIYCIAWSEDDTYPHTLQVLINWNPKQAQTVGQLLLEGV
jgi:hypothetical protein